MFHCDGTILRMKDTITLPHDIPAEKVLLNNDAASIGVVMKASAHVPECSMLIIRTGYISMLSILRMSIVRFRESRSCNAA
jgi:hypothetical protein